ncbi:hypothetical protein [Actinopolymorpha alba]|uniref:hypothetical protein n=1 Tax=Actinopolymorpha alba TaxID=533267 RepID=UPI00192C663D|nr:hypothetical protein [Actinopolymorpha alba]
MVVRLILVLLMAASVLAGAATPASAHGISAGDDLSLAATVAGTELTLTIRRTPAAPGPLQVDVIAHQPVRDLKLGLKVRSTETGLIGMRERVELLGGSLRTGSHAGGGFEVLARLPLRGAS